MAKHALAPLVRFCAGQARTFDPGAWRESESLDRKTLAVAAKYLSMTSWYGHESALERVAEELRPEMSSPEQFHREATAIGFELSYFSVAVRYQIVMDDRSTARAANS
jgi:hypothetical protein